MRRRSLAGLTTLAVLAGCFPHNPKARRIAYGVELGVAAGGIAMLALAKPAVDCDRFDDSCKDTANLLSGIGVVLVLAGIAGLVATVSTAEDAENAATQEKPVTPAPVTPAPVEPAATPAPAAAPPPAEPPPAADPGSGSGSDSGSGSGSG